MTETDDQYRPPALLEFLDTAGEKGWINTNSARALRITVQKVLEIETDWQNLNLETLDVEDLLDRWQTLRRSRYGDASMRVYRARFKQAHRMYMARISGDPAWKTYGPTARTTATAGGARSNSTSTRKVQPERSAAPANGESARTDVISDVTEPIPTSRPTESPATRPALMEFPFPLRDDLDAFLRLPRDLRTTEADRLCAYIKSLARDDQPAKSAPVATPED